VPLGGPLAGLVAGLEAVGAEASVVLVAGGDMPTLEPAVLRLLVAAATAPGAAAAVLESAPPAPLPLAVRPGPALAAARALLAADRRSLAGLVEALGARGVEAERWRALDPAGATLADVDVPADLR
jgi:molybdopterin-guanine dinucleotide biosynthesis protein A